MEYYEVFIPLTSPQSDALVYKLDKMGYSGFMEENNGIYAYIDKEDFNEKELDSLLSRDFQLSKDSCTIKTIPHQNWNHYWEQNFQPQIIADHVLVKAPFHNVKESYPYEILIEPQMAFGTGHHPTTSMMIQLQLDLDFKDKLVFDFGTGSGILAILAEKMGAIEIYANEIQEDAIRNAYLNVEQNSCQTINLSQKEFPDFPPMDKRYDIILANITRNTIIDSLPYFNQLLKMQGYLLASGFLISEQEKVVEQFEKEGYQPVKILNEDKWSATLFKKS